MSSLAGLAILQTSSFLPDSLRQFLRSLKNFGETPEPELVKSLRLAFRNDLWLLLTLGLRRLDFNHPWLFARCLEIQKNPDGYLDLWARDHRKSSAITFAKTIQDILASHGDDPLPEWAGLEPTFGIFSHTRPAAKSFIRQIKVELERNSLLKYLFPEILYEVPDRQAPRWSEDSGLMVKRKSNPKEASIEAWGLVDGQPTGKHFDVLIYDDVVTRESISSPEMIEKTTKAWSDSLNLGSASPRIRMIGTRWHFADTYRDVMQRQAAIPRIYPATEDGTLTGKAVLLTQEQLEKKVRDMGPYVASAQLLLDPTVDSKQRFLREWLSHQFDRSQGWQAMNRAMICDPASGKKSSDYTAIAVIGYGSDNNVYLLDMVRDRLTLQQRADEYMRLHRKWKIGWAGYEEYGLQADIEYLKERMDRETYHFEIEPLKGKLSKFDRVNRLIPIAAEGRFWMPESIMRTNCEGKLEDMVVNLVEQEFLAWPVPAYDDGIDAISRVFDLDIPWPMPVPTEHKDDRYSKRKTAHSWMAS
jgi:predicted phage terminase large subunit-like protein